MFPSPTGDLYFSIKKEERTILETIVSVPYRGLIFLNYQYRISVSGNQCFRPLPGTYISQLLKGSYEQN